VRRWQCLEPGHSNVSTFGRGQIRRMQNYRLKMGIPCVYISGTPAAMSLRAFSSLQRSQINPSYQSDSLLMASSTPPHACSACEILCDTFHGHQPEPGWRNWQTQRTQNPPTLAVMGVRPPLPAPYLKYLQISGLVNAQNLCAQDCAQTVPRFPPYRHHVYRIQDCS
jgi:hypothetical protein